jgi:hypothetical protein
MTTKPNSIGEIDTKKEKLPPHTEKGHRSGGGKDGEAMEKTIADSSFKVDNASVKGELIEEISPISRVVKRTDKDGWTDGQTRTRTMAAGSSVTWMHCSIRYKVT